MRIKMCPAIRFMSVIVLLVVDTRTGAIQQKDVEPRRCYQCAESRVGVGPTPDCDNGDKLEMTTCPPDKPYCATVASTPNFTSSLICAAAADRICSLSYSENKTYEMICVCTDHLCNAPFSRELKTELINFSSSNSTKNGSDMTDFFWKFYTANHTEQHIYKEFDFKENKGVTELSASNLLQQGIHSTKIASATVKTHGKHVDKTGGPQAEALKQEATLPSEDDEDESEGSGSEEEPHAPRHPASAPAAPSSFLPADDNNAQPLFVNFLTMTLLLLYLIL